MNWTASLRWKLTGLLAAAGLFTAAITTVGFAWLDLERNAKRARAEATAMASIIADQVGPALTLKDERTASEILASLGTDTRFRDAVLYRKDGACFAMFHRQSTQGCPGVPRDGARENRGVLVVAREVLAGSERTGTLAIWTAGPSMATVVREYLGGAVLILVLSLLVAAGLAFFLQGRVAEPILAIAGAAQRMAENRRFQERVPANAIGIQEVGVLARSFNLMLDEIERRDAELAWRRRQLEEEVHERSRVNSELKAAKEKAEEAARIKSEFLANMSHEIRTPLNGVMGMISLALDHCEHAEEKEQLQAAQTAADSLSTILNEILDLSKIEAGKMVIESIPFDLNHTVRDCLSIFELKAREKGLELRVRFAPDCPEWVEGDPLRLRQVLINLLGNAIKFTMQGQVVLSLEPRGAENLRFGVEDTGIGISTEKLASIFEPFTQADGSHTRRYGGSGLGLTITRRLVEIMEGHVSVDSEVGKGSQFWIDLPLRPCTAAVHSEKEVMTRELPPLHVLVAEDNPINQKVLRGMLGKQGWTVVLAEDGAQAFECFLRERFDAILMDIQMPELDGLEATGRIREVEQQRGLSRTPILAFTAHALAAQHEECLAAGMDGVVTKPVGLAALVQAVAAVLQPTSL